jgi:V-type H+-transporting ATPase subunit D
VCVPTVTVLAVMKARLQGATKGHALLKKKADALNMRFRSILKKIVQTKQEMGSVMKQSFFSLAQARYATGDFSQTVLDSIGQVRAVRQERAARPPSRVRPAARHSGTSPKWVPLRSPAAQASIKVRTSTDNVAGVKLPKFDSVREGTDSNLGLIGLGTGGKQIQECRCATWWRRLASPHPRRPGRGAPAARGAEPAPEARLPVRRRVTWAICTWGACRKSFLGAVELLVELASLQTAFLTLDEAIKTTNRRVNALEHVVKPRLENTIQYIKVGSGARGGESHWCGGGWGGTSVFVAGGLGRPLASVFLAVVL